MSMMWWNCCVESVVVIARIKNDGFISHWDEINNFMFGNSGLCDESHFRYVKESKSKMLADKAPHPLIDYLMQDMVGGEI